MTGTIGVVNEGISLFERTSGNRGPEARRTYESGCGIGVPIVGEIVVVAWDLPDFSNITRAISPIGTGVRTVGTRSFA